MSKACEACAGAKVKCHDEKPCRRCLKRGIRCTSTSREYVPASRFDKRRGGSKEHHNAFSPDLNSARDGVCNEPGSQPLRTSPFPVRAESEPKALMDDAMSDIAWFTNESLHESLLPANTTEAFAPSLTSDMELCPGASFTDFFLANFDFDDGWEELITKGRIRQASEAYKTSLWYSVPDQGSMRRESIARELGSPLTDEKPEALLKEFRSSAPHRFNHFTRDSLFATLIIRAHTQSPGCLQNLYAAFPPPDLLNLLIHSFFAKQDQKVDSWIHSASFEPNARNQELTAMILAASALNTSSPALHRLGISLRRLLRPLILDKVRLLLRMSLSSVANRPS